MTHSPSGRLIGPKVLWHEAGQGLMPPKGHTWAPRGPKGFTWADYRDLIIAAHRRLGAPVVYRWRGRACAARPPAPRRLRSPAAAHSLVTSRRLARAWHGIHRGAQPGRGRMRIHLGGGDARMPEQILHFIERAASVQTVESNVPTTLNTSAGAGGLEAIPRVGDCECGLVRRRSGSSQLRLRASI